MKRPVLFATIITLLTAGAAIAQEAAPIVWSGGIGQDERQLIEERQNDYALKIVFTGDAGMYVSGVHVVITDKDNVEVVNTVTQGPVLLADLPPGRYAVKTSAEGFAHDFKVTLHSKLTTQHVRYKQIKDDSGV